MTIITTLETLKAIEEMVNYNSHLVEEGEVVKVKNSYSTKTYKKVNGKMINMILPTRYLETL